MFRHGSDEGPTAIQRTLEDLFGQNKTGSSGAFGSKTYDVLKEVAENQKLQQTFLDRLSERRKKTDKYHHAEDSRMEYFRFVE